MRRLIFPLLLGVVGVAVLCALGGWQVQRMQWKADYLADISARIGAVPVPVPAIPDPTVDNYLPVTAYGRFTGEVIQVLASQEDVGPGKRIIEVFETEGRRLLVDRGFVLDGAKRPTLIKVAQAQVVGKLQWPKDANSFTPVPDAKTGLWFARDVPGMAAKLKAEPILIVARAPTGDGIVAMPVDTSNIPNDHWGYAITWFLLAAVWAAMSAALIWRNRKTTV